MDTVLASGISTTGAVALISGFAVVLIAFVAISILAMAFGSKGGQTRRVAEKVVIVVIGASMLAGAAVWAKINILSTIVH